LPGKALPGSGFCGIFFTPSVLAGTGVTITTTRSKFMSDTDKFHVPRKPAPSPEKGKGGEEDED